MDFPVVIMGPSVHSSDFFVIPCSSEEWLLRSENKQKLSVFERRWLLVFA